MGKSTPASAADRGNNLATIRWELPDRGGVAVGVAELRFRQAHREHEIGPLEMRTTEVGLLEICSPEAGPPKMRKGGGGSVVRFAAQKLALWRWAPVKPAPRGVRP